MQSDSSYNKLNISYVLLPMQFLGKKAKRVIIFPIVFAAISAIINIGSMAAIGYFSNDANLHDMSRIGGKSGQIRAALNPALKVVKAVSSSFFTG